MTGAAGAVHPAAAPAGRTFDVRRLGRMGYDEAVALQAALVEERRAGVIGDTLLFVEHPPVITLGVRTRTGASHIVASASELGQRGVLVRETGRGGDVTYHGPGQLVGYPIFDLNPDRRDVHQYVRDLEEALIRAVATFGVEARRLSGLTGVWTGPAGAEEKLAVAESFASSPSAGAAEIEASNRAGTRTAAPSRAERDMIAPRGVRAAPRPRPSPWAASPCRAAACRRRSG